MADSLSRAEAERMLAEDAALIMRRVAEFRETLAYLRGLLRLPRGLSGGHGTEGE